MAEEEAVATNPVSPDNKRKLDDLETETTENAVSNPPSDIKTEISSFPPAQNQENPNSSSVEVQNAIQEAQENANCLSKIEEVKKPRLEEQTDSHVADLDHHIQKAEEPPMRNSQHHSMIDSEQATPVVSQQGDLFSGDRQPTIEPQNISRSIEVPNTKIGVLIGKAGDTIRNLQFNSGAKIQIRKDCDTNPYSTTRQVELIGNPENVNKAEQLIKDVIAEADAGGSPALVARGFGTAPTGGEEIQIQIPNEKVGLIIGKGGETIRNLQTKSGARIQLIPQHLPEGDVSKERTVRVTGNMKHMEAAREMIKDIMNQPARSSSISAGYNQQSYRPRGSPGQQLWGARGTPPTQQAGYDYQQRGPYPSPAQQFPPQTYPCYPRQQAPRTSFNSGWNQRPQAPLQTPPPQSGGYDNYGQASHIAVAPGSAPGPVTAPATGSTQVNYNYGQSQGPQYYGQPTSYSQSVAPQQSYGHQGYDDPNYGKQAPSQHVYGGPLMNSQHTSYSQTISSQPGHTQPVAFQPTGYIQQGSSTISEYPQQSSALSGYVQQGYGKPTYGTPSPGPAPVSYAPPRATSQPEDVPNQGPTGTVPSQSYGSSMSSQQSYPYGSSGSSQQSYPYGSTSGTNDGYAQTQQPSSDGSYGQYTSSQPGYGEQQQTQNNANYGYQGPTDTGYNSQQNPVYGVPTSAPTSAQGGYGNLSSYEQPAPQPGYGSLGAQPAGYSNSLSTQPGYNQYNSGQMYGHH